ncbi:MAG: hypothetical protein ACO3QV_07745, partial [Candidatus Nanopelagicaceae bacterium]
MGQDDPDELELPAGLEVETPVLPGATAPSSTADPDREPEPFSQEEMDLFGSEDGNDYRDVRPRQEQYEDVPPIIPEAEEVNLLVLKPSFKSRKGRELNPKYFNAEEHVAFLKSDAENWQKHLDHDAAEVIPPEKVKDIPRDKILPIHSRFVRT